MNKIYDIYLNPQRTWWLGGTEGLPEPIEVAGRARRAARRGVFER